MIVELPGPDLQVWAKPLADSSRAVVLLNRSPLQTVITVPWWSLRLKGPAKVRNVWTHIDAGTFDRQFSATVPAHGAVMVRITSVTGN
jgi:alpha-galactosidase